MSVKHSGQKESLVNALLVHRVRSSEQSQTEGSSYLD